MQYGKQIRRKTMAEEIADSIGEEILRGRFKPGDTLPTEPQLTSLFGVSRTVIRDATRMLAARGLVDVRHGKGAYITESPSPAFGEALLLALRRKKASVWDVEEFHLTLQPEVYALAAEHAGEHDLARIRAAAENYIQEFRKALNAPTPADAAEPVPFTPLREAFREFSRAVFDATGNALFSLIADSILRLITPRNWYDPEMPAEEAIKLEREEVMARVEAVESRSPEKARRILKELLELPEEAVRAMKNTPAGEITRIPVSSRTLKRPRDTQD